MTAKEKANELVEKFRDYVAFEGGIMDEKTNQQTETENAVQCAIICVDEIIKGCEETTPFFHRSNAKDYWQEVKQEIEKL